MRPVMDCAEILKRIEFLMGRAGIGLDIIDSDFNIRYIDPAWARAYGDPSGKRCYQYFMGRTARCPRCGVAKALRTRRVVTSQEVLKREGGKPIKVTSVPFRAGSGRWMVAETNVDITDMKKNEDAIRLSEAKYRALFEYSNDAIIIADTVTGKLVDCNSRATELTGYSKKKLLSMRAAQLHPKYAVKDAMAHFRMLAAGRPNVVYTVVLTSRGKIIEVSISGSRIISGGKKLLIGIFRDITAQKEAERKISYLAKLSEECPNPIIRIGMDKKVLYANKVAKTGLGVRGVREGDLIPKRWRSYFNKLVRGKGILRDIEATMPDARTFSWTAIFLPRERYVNVYGVDVTAKRKAQDQMRRSETRFRTIFNSAAIGAVISSIDGRIVDVNHAFCDFIGYPAKYIIGKTVRDITYPDDWPASRRFLRRLAKGFKPGMLEKRYICRDGALKWGEVTSMVMKTDDRGPAYTIAQIQDITERKKAESALRESMSKIKSISDNLAGGLIYQIVRKKDGTRKFTYVSDKVNDFYGVTPIQAMNDPRLIYGRVHHEDRARLRREEESAFRAMRTFESEARIVGPDGNIRWSYFISHPNKLSDGSTSWDGIEFNITDRKKAEMALLEANSALSSTLESSFSGMLVVDSYGKITRFNKRFADMWGIPRPVMVSGSDSIALRYVTKRLKHPKQFISRVRYLYKHPLQESRDIIEFKDGRFFERYSRPQMIGREVAGRVWTFHDITEIKKAEKVLERDKTELRRLVREKSDELLNANKELYRSRRLSELGTLAATIAHELRTPLAAIRTAAYNIRSKSRNASLTSHIDTVEKKVSDSDRIIKNLLFYANIKPPQREKVVICDLLKECVGLTKEMFRCGGSSIRVACKRHKDLTLDADPVQLKEVFYNLLSNACEACGSRKPRILISISLSRRYAKISVKDNGCGIHKDDVNRLFEPFFSKKPKGTGLGLAISRQIIELHNGRISVKSEFSKWTEITVLLPVGK